MEEFKAMSNAIKVLYGLDIDKRTREAKNGNLYTTVTYNSFEHAKDLELKTRGIEAPRRGTGIHTRTIRVFYNEKTIKFGNSVYMYFKPVKRIKHPPKNKHMRDHCFYKKNPEMLEKIKNAPWKAKYKFDKSKFIFKITKKGKLQVLERLDRPHVKFKGRAFDYSNCTKHDRFMDVTKRWETQLKQYIMSTLVDMSVDRISVSRVHVATVKQYVKSPEELKNEAQWDNLKNVAKLLFKEIKSKVKELEKKQ